jgi:hypothetical protein
MGKWSAYYELTLCFNGISFIPFDAGTPDAYEDGKGKNNLPQMKSQKRRAKKESTQPDHRSAVIERVTQFVRDQLSAGATAPDLSYALAYIATDLGLHLAPDARQVFPVVLDGVARASLAHFEASRTQGAEGKAEPVPMPGTSTLH